MLNLVKYHFYKLKNVQMLHFHIFLNSIITNSEFCLCGLETLQLKLGIFITPGLGPELLEDR